MEEKKLSKEDYNNIPVYYCNYCLSLKVKTVAGGSLGLDHCAECGGTDILETHISEWEKMYENKYGVKYLNSSI